MNRDKTRSKNWNIIEKSVYVPPTVKIYYLTLEGSIALQSPIQKVRLNDWIEEGPEVPANNSDIWLDF
jgi:hypothetical protein